MAYRTAEIIDHLRFKNTLAQSDCNAILKTGEALPVFIRRVNGVETFLVEIEASFFQCEKLPNFVRFEQKPEETAKQAAEPPAIESTALKVEKRPWETDWEAARRTVEAINRKARGEQYVSRQSQQGYAPDPERSRAAHEENQKVAARMRPQR